MRFDSNKAWTEAMALVSANRDVLWAVAGVFLVLPVFAVALLLPPPQPPAGAEPKALIDLLGAYYTENAHWLLLVAAVQVLGTLTMLALFTDRTRPTVGEAMQQGLRGMPSSIAAQLLAGMGVFLIAIVPITLAGVLKSNGLMVLALLLFAVGLVYVMVRIVLVAPVVIVDQQRNPVSALRRSWELTKGQVGRLLLFFVLLVVGQWILVAVVGGLVDLALRFVLGQEIGTPLGTFVSAALQGIMAIYLTAAIAATHRQLSGPSVEASARPFI